MKQIFVFLLFILFISLSQESNKIPKNGCGPRIPVGSCRYPKIFTCRNGRLGCYLFYDLKYNK